MDKNSEGKVFYFYQRAPEWKISYRNLIKVINWATTKVELDKLNNIINDEYDL